MLMFLIQNLEGVTVKSQLSERRLSETDYSKTMDGPDFFHYYLLQ